MRFGLVHRVMTDALAALGVLAVVSTASLTPWTNVVLVVGLLLAIAVPEGWQGRPALRHFATIAPLGIASYWRPAGTASGSGGGACCSIWTRKTDLIASSAMLFLSDSKISYASFSYSTRGSFWP